MHVALLRGINVGGKNPLPMTELAAMFSGVGCEDVRTYIQSGNVIFRAGSSLARRVPALIAEGIADRFGFEVPVVLRTASEFNEVPRRNPFLLAGVDPRQLHVVFLARKPTKAMTATLESTRSPPDRFALSGREIFLDCPNGVGRTKLTNRYFDSRLDTVSTMRNWKTVLALDGLLGVNAS